jgi:hypothetical protein
MTHPADRDRRRPMETEGSAYGIESHDSGVHVRGAPNSSIQLTIDKGIGRQFLIIIWVSAFVAALAVLVMLVLWDAHRVTRQHVKILEYDLMDLRTKTGNAHENTE